MSREIYTAARGSDSAVHLARFGRPPRSSGFEFETPKHLDFLIAKYLSVFTSKQPTNHDIGKSECYHMSSCGCIQL
jgi:hypothetical protein